MIGEGIDRQFDRLAAPHSGKLGFLEVGDDIDVRQRHHGKHRRARLDILPQLDALVADHAIHRRADDGVPQIVMGEIAVGDGLTKLRLRFLPGCLEHAKLVALRRLAGHGLVDRCFRLAQVGFRRVVALLADIVAGDQAFDPVVILPGAVQVRLRAGGRSVALGDHRMLKDDTAVNASDGGLRRLRRRFSLSGLGAIFGIVQDDQHVAGRDFLVFGHADFGRHSPRSWG